VAVRIGDDFWSEQTCKLVWVSTEDILAGWQVFTTFDDKKWSFTDCVSYAVMKRLGIREAYALDDDVRQFGFVHVKP
jgi:predicted nucleic acid-binding protein